jgi:hypothetical protein
MKFSSIHKYFKECLAISSIKFLITPAFILLIVTILDLGRIENGLVLKY